jgi:hypothetical protein
MAPTLSVAVTGKNDGMTFESLCSPFSQNKIKKGLKKIKGEKGFNFRQKCIDINVWDSGPNGPCIT